MSLWHEKYMDAEFEGKMFVNANEHLSIITDEGIVFDGVFVNWESLYNGDWNDYKPITEFCDGESILKVLRKTLTKI